MKKIILVSNASWTMVKFRYGLMKSLVENSYDIYVVSPYDEYSQEIEKLGCKFINITMDNQGSNPLKDINLVYDLYKIYQRINPDLIIHYTIKPNIYGSFATKLSGYKSLSVIPGLGYTFINDNFTAKMAKVLYKMALKIPEQIWFINQDDKKEFIDRNLVNENKVFIINGEGVNIDKFKPLEMKKGSNTFIFLLIGRVIKDKGVYEYVEAAKLLKDNYNVEFQLMGLTADNPTAIKETEIQKWKKDGIINYLGSSSDVREFIQQVDCIVLPSYREGLSMSLMESASMAKPIVTSNITGCKEVVDEGVNGFLCEVRSAQDLAAKMEKMINLSENERMAMGKAGREKMVKEFDEKIVIDKYLESIKEILQS